MRVTNSPVLSQNGSTRPCLRVFSSEALYGSDTVNRSEGQSTSNVSLHGQRFSTSGNSLWNLGEKDMHTRYCAVGIAVAPGTLTT